MKSGVVFLKLLISFFLLMLLFGLSGPMIFDLNQKLLFTAEQQIYDNELLTALNKVYFEVKSCQQLINTLDHPTDKNHISFISAKNEEITFQSKNGRLARTTGGTFYLTPAHLTIKDLEFIIQGHLVTISFTAVKDSYNRKFYRTLELINV